MKQTTGLFFALAGACALCLLTSCGTSNDPAQPDAYVPPDAPDFSYPDAHVTPDVAPVPVGDIQIQLLTTKGDPVAEALVSLGNQPVGNTNVDGLFCAQDVVVGPMLVRLTSANCSMVEENALVRSEEITTLKLTCLPMISAILPDAVAGGIISGPNGFELVIPPDAFTLNGDPVGGSVDVRYGILNAPEDMRAAPGMLAEAGSSTFELESYGMVEVTFTKFGEQLDFEGEAILTLPLTTGASFVHGESVALWSFNEDTGFWQQEGFGTVDTLSTGEPLFVATVTHFSWWNCDEPLSDKNCIEGRLLDGNGDPATGAVVELEGEDYLYSTSTVTGADGRFCVDVKRESLNHCAATYADNFQFVSWDATQIQAGATATTCNLGACTDLGDLTMTPTEGLAVCP